MPLPNLKPTSKSITLLIVVAAILFFGGLFAYFGTSGSLKAATAELNDKQTQVDNNKKIAHRLSEAEAKFIQTKAQLRYLETSVSTQAYVPTLLKQLEGLAKEVKLKVVSVRPSSQVEMQQPRKLSSDRTNPEAGQQQQAPPPQQAQGAPANGQGDPNANTAGAQAKTEPYDTLTIDVEVEGSYWNTLSFLYKITTFPKIMAVNNLQVSPNGAVINSKSPDLHIRVNLTAYVFREDEKAQPPAPNPAPPVTSAKSDRRHDNEAG